MADDIQTPEVEETVVSPTEEAPETEEVTEA